MVSNYETVSAYPVNKNFPFNIFSSILQPEIKIFPDPAVLNGFLSIEDGFVAVYSFAEDDQICSKVICETSCCANLGSLDPKVTIDTSTPGFFWRNPFIPGNVASKSRHIYNFDCILIALAASDPVILQSDFPASRLAPDRSGRNPVGR
ncbi:MAG: hypothetical protein MUO63_03175 [Desulfobulbaceae bacterium]|nr:hypothetical protein [Desulfobulbaceae bacterium]